jgi:hypothetical protein
MTTNRRAAPPHGLAWGTSEFLEQRGLMPAAPTVDVSKAIAREAVRVSSSTLVERYMELQEQADPMSRLELRVIGQRLVRALAWLLADDADPRIRAIAARYSE